MARKGSLYSSEDTRQPYSADDRALRMVREKDGSLIERLSSTPVHSLFSGLQRKLNVSTGVTHTDIGLDDFMVGNTGALIGVQPRNFDLPTVSTENIGQMWIVIDVSGDAATHPIKVRATPNINGSAADFIVTTNYAWVIIVTDGTNFFAREL